MVGAAGVTYIGNYGLAPGTARLDRETVVKARRLIEPELASLPCVTLEDKSVAFALHYRNCDDGDAVRRKLLGLSASVAAETGVRVVEGKKVVELTAADLRQGQRLRPPDRALRPEVGSLPR
jgi:trehalose-phosphatase